MIRFYLFIGICFIVSACSQNDKAQKEDINKAAVRDIEKSSNHSYVPLRDTPVAAPKPQAYNEEIKNLPPDLSRFILPGYTALDTVWGDLNLDAYPDMIMVLKKNGEDSTSDVVEHPEKRPLLILIGQPDKTLKQAARNDNSVYCVNCGGMMGDPFEDVVIKKGYFSVEHYGGSGWRWTRTITFKYSPADNNWFLHKDGGDSFHAAEPEKYTTKVRTVKDFGKVPFDKFDIYKEQ